MKGVFHHNGSQLVKEYADVPYEGTVSVAPSGKTETKFLNLRSNTNASPPYLFKQKAGDNPMFDQSVSPPPTVNYKKPQKSLGRAIGAVNKESKIEQAKIRQQLSRMRAETVELPNTSGKMESGQHVSMGFVNYVGGVPVSVQLNESADFVMNNSMNK